MSIQTIEISVPGSIPSSVEIEGGFGPQVVEINQGAPGATGPQGSPGPNVVNTNTQTTLTGLLKGNGTNVAVATAGTDYAPASEFKSADFTAVVGRKYTVASAGTVTVDVPVSGTNGDEIEIYVRTGSVLISPATIVVKQDQTLRRVYYNGGWANSIYTPSSGSNTGDETATTIKDKLGITVLSGSNTGDQTDITGNAGTATAALGLKTATTTVSISSATAPTSGQVLTATSSTNATWQTPSSSESIPQRFGTNYRQILRRVKTAMDMGQESLSIQVIGDSMGDAQGSSTTTGEWVSQVAYRIAALYPGYNVVHKIYDQPTALYTSYQVQTGSSGDRYLNIPSGNIYSHLIEAADMIAPTTGDADVRVKFSINAYSGLATGVLAAELGTRWRLMVSSSKQLIFTWFNSSGGFNQATSSAYTNADNTPIWVRVTMEGNSGGSNVVKFYTGTNGTTWTQLGSTQTNPWSSGVQSMNTTNQLMEIGARGLSSEPLKGAKIYEIQNLDGVNGPPRCSMTPDAWLWQGYGTPGTNAPTLAGSPTLTINNASVYGYSISGLLGLTNRPWLRNDGRGITILAQGYNNPESATGFAAQVDAALTAVRVRRPLDNFLVIVEPFSSANTATLPYLKDMQQRGVLMNWAPRNGAGLIDMHGIFINNGGSLFSDDIHPNATGSALWATSFMTAFSE